MFTRAMVGLADLTHPTSFPAMPRRAVSVVLMLALVAVSLTAPAGAQFAPPPERMRPATEWMTRPGEWEGASVRGWESERVAARSGPHSIVHLPPIDLPEHPSQQPSASNRFWDFQPPASSLYVWQFLPDGLIYKAYLAGLKESRIGTQVFYEQDEGWKWDSTLGGRAGIFRYGTTDVLWPEGWQVDVEGAAFPRLDPAEAMDLDVVDFRIGVPVTWGVGPWRTKLAYYHLSAHYGDEFLLRTPGMTRYNYSRDAIVFGLAYYATDDVRLYAEADWGVIHADVAEPWAFQFGVEYSPARPTGLAGAPFLAVGAHLRQELDFSGNLVVQAGWQWRGNTGHLVRAGLHYHNGLSNQFEIYDRFEQQIGFGMWYDF